jgi:hypothetical protein
MVGLGEVRAAPPQKSHLTTWKTEAVWKDLNAVMKLSSHL